MSSPNLNPLNNGSYWGPTNETPREILDEKSFMASCWISGVTCGMQFMIYLLCVNVLLAPSSTFTSGRLQVQQPPKSKSTNPHYRRVISRFRNLSSFTLFLLTYSTLLCVVNILYTGTSYVALQLTYISNRNFPFGPLVFLSVESILPSNVINSMTIVLSSVLSDALLLWRCRLIWKLFTGWKADLVMLFPLMLLLGSFAMGMLWTLKVTLTSDVYEFIAITHVGLAYYTLSLSTNILLTSLVVIRIYIYQLHLRRAIGHGHGYDDQYTGIMAMFVESSVLSCMGSLFQLVATALESGLAQVGSGFTPAFQIISTYLIILRVGQGRAWSKTTIHQNPEAIGASTTANRGVLSTIVFAPQERSLQINFTGVDATGMDISQLECGDMTGVRNGNGIDGEEIYVFDEGEKVTSG